MLCNYAPGWLQILAYGYQLCVLNNAFVNTFAMKLLFVYTFLLGKDHRLWMDLSFEANKYAIGQK